MSARSRVKRLEELLGRGRNDFPAPTPEDIEQFEAAKAGAIAAMLLATMELGSITDPADVAGIKLSLGRWCTSSVVDLDRAVALVQELLALPEAEQAALRRGREPEADVLDDEDGAAEDEHDPADCTYPKCAAARLADSSGNGNGNGEPPGGWAGPVGDSPGAF